VEEYLQSILAFGVSIAGSSVQGWITKKRPGIDNDRIPVQNSATWGTAGIVAGQATGDPLTMVAGFAGATVASLGHKLIKKLF
jgi:hypothetical protein